MTDLTRELRLWPLPDLRARRDHLRRELAQGPRGVFGVGEFAAWGRERTSEMESIEKVLRERGEG